MPPSHRNFVVIAPMIMKFGTVMKLDVLYTIVTRNFVKLLLLFNYDVITVFYPTHRPEFQILVTHKLIH